MDLIPTSALDEPITLAPKTRDDAFRRVDDLVASAVANKDPLIAISGIASLTGMEWLAGMSKAKLFWEINHHWKDFGIEEEFTDFVIEHTGSCQETIDRYILVWEMYERNLVPKSLQSTIMGRSMRDQVEIAKIADRVELKKPDWDRIAAASNGQEITQLKREFLHLKPRKSGLTIRLRRNGDVEAYDSEKGKHFVGYLEVDAAKTDPQIAKAIERITRSAGILVE